MKTMLVSEFKAKCIAALKEVQRTREPLSAVFMAMTFAVFVVYGFVAHAFRRLVIESPGVQRWLRYSVAAAFAGLGARLAVSER
ncbi:MAG TPA: hypothetical protein VMN81_12080 [Vicinamibacterales bacterium]|nr:hypothetical protein [Vicinamibacterales bacterium]